MTSYATMKTTTAEIDLLKSDAEYAKLDKLVAKHRKIFKELKALEELGLYGTEQWKTLFEKYAVAFKKANGYRPHWVRS